MHQTTLRKKDVQLFNAEWQENKLEKVIISYLIDD